MVLDHWESLDGFARRRFPGNEAHALEASQFVLDKLEQDGWRRVCAWRGTVNFVSFLGILARRLYTDFDRERYGYHRKPKWLKEKQDPLWHNAYRLYAIENQGRRAVIEILSSDPSRQRRYIEEVVSTIAARCQPVVEPKEEQWDEADLRAVPDGMNPGPVEQLTDKEHQDTVQLLIAYISDGDATKLSSEIRDQLSTLRALDLSDEERLMIKLREIDNVQLQTIKNMLHYDGDIYKRYKKVIRQIRDAVETSGLIEALVKRA